MVRTFLILKELNLMSSNFDPFLTTQTMTTTSSDTVSYYSDNGITITNIPYQPYSFTMVEPTSKKIEDVSKELQLKIAALEGTIAGLEARIARIEPMQMLKFHCTYCGKLDYENPYYDCKNGKWFTFCNVTCCEELHNIG